jgi:drug/metabolite transporter (DMT)-like permease
MTQATADEPRRGAYAILALLTLVWGFNWVAMKWGLENAAPVVLNLQRTWLAIVVLFVVLIVTGRPLRPPPLLAIVVTGFFQTTLNFGATLMAVDGGGAGRASILVFTMPFWTLMIAWPVLGERVRGNLWIAVACALAGLTFVVAPWQWQGDLAPKLWAVLSGFGWAGGTVLAKYFQRRRSFDMLNFMTWQMLAGVLPLSMLPLFDDYRPTQWSAWHAALLLYIGALSTGGGFLMWLAVLSRLSAGTASLNMFAIPVIALVSSMLIFGETLSANEWIGIALIGLGLAIVTWRAWRATRRLGPAVR